jgi:hypothetical protein
MISSFSRVRTLSKLPCATPRTLRLLRRGFSASFSRVRTLSKLSRATPDVRRGCYRCASPSSEKLPLFAPGAVEETLEIPTLEIPSRRLQRLTKPRIHGLRANVERIHR